MRNLTARHAFQFLLSLLLGWACLVDAFSRVGSLPSLTTQKHRVGTPLSAAKKIQTVVYDGAEFVSILSFLLLEKESSLESNQTSRLSLDPLQSANTTLPPKRAGYMAFAVGTSTESDSRLIGVKIPDTEEFDGGVQIDKDIFLYEDSIAEIPAGISDEDAISTAAAALCGVHCGMPRTGTNGDKDDNLGTVSDLISTGRRIPFTQQKNWPI